MSCLKPSFVWFILLTYFTRALVSGQSAPEHDSCRFSPYHRRDEIMENSTAFVDEIFYWDGRYHTDGIGYRTSNGVTIGHVSLSIFTGLPSSKLSDYTKSTPTSEAYHIMLLALALNGSHFAQTFVYGANPASAPGIAAAILQSKLDTYTAFNVTYPGYGGLLPVFESNVTAIRPSAEWHNRVAAAENGQLLLAVYGMIHVLSQSDRPELRQLGGKWWYWLFYALNNLKIILLRGPDPGGVCAVSTFNETLNLVATAQRYACEDDKCLNNNPFQGEIMTWILYFSRTLSQAEADQLWKGKRPQLQAVNFTGSIVNISLHQLGSINYTGNGIVGRHIMPITTQRGLYFSSDEQIKLLFLPYLDSGIVRRVFKNAERVRTCSSALGKVPGMFATAPDASIFPAEANTANNSFEYRYIRNTGVPSVAVNQTQELDIITPYSVFPTILFDKGIGLAWLKNMLDGKQMQTVFGSIAAARTDGSAVSRFVSWETKAPTLLALAGGFVDIVREAMKHDDIYNEFIRVVEREYNGVFGPLTGFPIMGEDVQLCLPNTRMPQSTLIDFTTCDSHLNNGTKGWRQHSK